MVNSVRSARHSILLGASVGAMVLACSPAHAAQTCPASGPCNLTVTQANQTVTVTEAGGTVVNTSTGTTINAHIPAFGGRDGVVIENRAGATIDALNVTSEPSFPYVDYNIRNEGLTIINAGTIKGDVQLYRGWNTFVNEGGTVTGALVADPGYSIITYIERNAAHPQAIDPGNAFLFDFYVNSLSTTGTITIPSALPTNFEAYGIEVQGSGTVATLVNGSNGPTNSGMVIYGNGSIINRAILNPLDQTIFGPDFPTIISTVQYLGVVGDSDLAVIGSDPIFGAVTTPIRGGLESFRNESTINGDITLSTAVFENAGDINSLTKDRGTLILGVADRDFVFTNTGQIQLTGQPSQFLNRDHAAVTVGTGPLTTTPSKATLTNEFRSSIVGGLEFDGIASEFLFTNKGIIGLQVGSELNYAVQLYVEPSAVNYASSGDPDVPANTSVIQNAGKIFGGLSGEFLTLDLSVENSGSITPIKRDPYADAVNLSVLGHGEEGELDAASASFANSGVVTGTVTLDLQASSVSVTNSGHISQDLSTSSPSSYVSAKSGLQVYQHTSLGADLSLVNTGTISSDDYAGVAVLVGIGAGDDWADMPGSQQATAHASITNSGTIIARGGQAVDFGFDPALDNSVALAVGLDARGQTSVDIHNEAGGIIRNEPGPFIIFSHIGPDPVAGMAIAAGADTVTLVNDGEISGAQSTVIGADLGLGVAVGKSLIPQNVLENVIGGAIDTFDSNDIITNSATGVIKGGIALRHGNDGFTNAGTVSGDVYMGTGNDVLFNTGLIDGNVDMGDGDDTFGILLAHAAPGGTKGITGTLDGGAGNDLLVFDVTGGGALEDMAKLHHTGFETTAIGGTGTVTANNLVLSAPIGLASGFVTLASGSSVSASTPGGAVFQGIAGVSQDLINQGSITGAISLGDETDSLTNYGTVNGNVDFGSGDDFFVQGINASLTGTADGGDGYDTFTLDITGGGTIRSALYNRIVNFELLGLTGSGTIVADGPLHFDTIGLMANTPITFGAGTTIQTDSEAAVTGSTGNDQLTNDGTINGDVNLGNGDDQYTNNGTMNGDVGAGLGDDHVTNNGTINGDVDLDGVGAPDGDGGGGNQQQQFARAFALAAVVVPTGGDDVLDNPGFIGGSVFAGAGNDQFTNSGTVGGDVYMGTGNDHFTLSGGVNGLIDLGDDNDVLELRDGWSIGGLGVLAGTGTDELRIATTSTYAEPTEIGLGQFGGFETVAVQSGVTAFSGNGAFDSIHVAGGRLIGRTGSEIDADVTVDQGATFGSAGLVRGDIVVNGTLSPGASPGTMTVVGDVQLGAGSSTVFEFTPSASDALVIDGTLTIASGASLTLSGTRPLTPGSYVLIDTTGGIHGTFGTNITRDDTILGVLRQTEDTLELISMFQLTSGANGQVTLTNAYLNALLTGGTATDGVLDAFPVLVGGDGFANQAVLATLNPEAYASVAQIGFENGQAIASALRGARVAGPDTGSGLFVFGQGFGAWRRFAGQDNGVSRANVRTGGYLGGVGFGNDVFGAALFVGRSDARQSIPGIAARNEADGMFFGGRVNVSAGGFDAGASLILDRAKADTTRNPATGVSKTNSHYDLHSTTLDGWVGYGFELGQGMKIGPQVGVTHTEVKRKGVTETGGGAFALQVAGQKYKLTTLTADIRASGPVSGKLRGWIEGGVRHRIDGDPITATAAFTGTGTSFTVNGASRAKTTAHFGAGAELTVAKNVDLFVNGDAEAKGGNGANRIDGGVRIRF